MCKLHVLNEDIMIIKNLPTSCSWLILLKLFTVGPIFIIYRCTRKHWRRPLHIKWPSTWNHCISHIFCFLGFWWVNGTSVSRKRRVWKVPIFHFIIFIDFQLGFSKVCYVLFEITLFVRVFVNNTRCRNKCITKVIWTCIWIWCRNRFFIRPRYINFSRRSWIILRYKIFIFLLFFIVFLFL